ncbi:MAG: methyltransferase domain-containing protein [Nitrospirae bacterium]|nr:methyltransferase domain-containing protein [Nitrospirota bacterium]
MQYVNCNLCGIDETSLITIQNNFKIVQCKQCGLVYINPQPDREELIKLYDTYHQRDEKDEHSWLKLMEGNFREVTVFLNRRFPDRGSLLDIGCAYGHFIAMMKGHGWSVKGIDPSAKALHHAREKGLDVIETTIDDSDFPACSFNVITAFYVLEHLFDPLSALKKIFHMLKPDGVLVLRVPHTTPIVKFLSRFNLRNNLYDTPFHLYDFSPETIRLLLNKAGFSSINIKPGSPTLPAKYAERVISVVSGNLSKILFGISGGRLLLPGTSKTVIAAKSAI